MTTVKDGDVLITQTGHVGMVEIQRPPHNFFDIELIRSLAKAFDMLSTDGHTRAIVLAAEGKGFCGGADFSRNRDGQKPGALYVEAVKLFRCPVPIVAAVQGAAIGGGVGLALVADFRVTCPSARFSVNFTRLGFHPGFGLSVTLPRLVGPQQAALLFYTGRRISGDEAVRIGLADVLADSVDDVRAKALALATEIAISAPLAIRDTRATLRAGLAQEVERAVQHEGSLQAVHFQTTDFKEGVAATAQRRDPVFTGR